MEFHLSNEERLIQKNRQKERIGGRAAMGAVDRINCRACRHYYITWDTSFPNGCRAYGIKSKEMPSSVVLKNSGESCKTFEAKIIKT
jgi:hypothetical protein